MPSPEEQAYSAVELAYGQGEFVRALDLAQALQPQLQPNRPDLLDQRLQLLLGHIHLYGLGQPRQAEAAYQAVLESCQEVNYRQLAEQSLQLCAEAVPEKSPAAIEEPANEGRDPEPPSFAEPATSSTEAEAPSALPATPWLQQLQDPQQALAQIQQAWATVVPAATPEPVPQAAAIEAARPWTDAGQEDKPELIPESDQSQVVVAATTIAQPEALDPPVGPSDQPEPEPATADNPAPSELPGTELTAAERIELERGLLLVRLSSREHTPAELEPNQPNLQELPPKGNSWTRLKERWRNALPISRQQPNGGGGSGR
ncbi:MAG: hypothetical protein RLZZ423_297 [Cyanobacteriota bacterium]